jgi:hypothetical protein
MTDARARLAELLDRAEEVLAAYNPVKMLTRDERQEALKAYVMLKPWKTADTYADHVWAYMRRFFKGEYDAFQFIDAMAAEIENQYMRAWREGAAEMGAYPEDFTAEDDAQIESIITDNTNYLDGIAGDIEQFISEGPHTDAEFSAAFQSRVSLWSVGYERTVNQARLHFGTKQRLIWVAGPTEQGCPTCNGLNGIVAWAQEWEEAGVLPRGEMLQCGGWRCLCSLERTDARRSPGALSRILDIMTAVNLGDKSVKYSDDQPRDEAGRWTDGGGVSEGGTYGNAVASDPHAQEYASVTPGQRKMPGDMSKKEYESLQVVYRGERAGSSQEGHVFVSNDRELAAQHGKVKTFRVLPGSKIYPDPEIEGFADRSLSGFESLQNGSAVINYDDMVLDLPYEWYKR